MRAEGRWKPQQKTQPGKMRVISKVMKKDTRSVLTQGPLGGEDTLYSKFLLGLQGQKCVQIQMIQKLQQQWRCQTTKAAKNELK